MSKIGLLDTMTTALEKMSECNPGAIVCLINIMKESPVVDPQCAMGGLGPILHLDTLGIYGSRIYVLWNNCCGRNTTRLLAVLRAVQLGLYSDNDLKAAIDGGQGRGQSLVEKADELLAKVQKELPDFNNGKPLQDTGERKEKAP